MHHVEHLDVVELELVLHPFAATDILQTRVGFVEPEARRGDAVLPVFLAEQIEDGVGGVTSLVIEMLNPGCVRAPKIEHQNGAQQHARPKGARPAKLSRLDGQHRRDRQAEHEHENSHLTNAEPCHFLRRGRAADGVGLHVAHEVRLVAARGGPLRGINEPAHGGEGDGGEAGVFPKLVPRNFRHRGAGLLQVFARQTLQAVSEENHQRHVRRVHELHRVADRGHVRQRVEQLVERRVPAPGKNDAHETHCRPEPDQLFLRGGIGLRLFAK